VIRRRRTGIIRIKQQSANETTMTNGIVYTEQATLAIFRGIGTFRPGQSAATIAVRCLS
jgi:hypothetical protein